MRMSVSPSISFDDAARATILFAALPLVILVKRTKAGAVPVAH